MRWFPFTTVGVVGGSMEPTLSAGDVCLVRKTRRVAVGDVVVAYHPTRVDFLVVKRAVRREGNGWWLLGDNSVASDDSRDFGAVEASALLGKVVWVKRSRGS